MWHRRRRGRLALEPEHRLSLIRNLAKELITHQRVVTTHLRAKEAARFTEKLITIARGNNLHARRRLVAELGSGTEAVAKRLIEVVVPKFSDRKGGCTRVLHYQVRKGDNAQLALVEFSTPIEIIKKKVRKKKERRPTEVKETKEVHEKKAPKEKEEQKSEKKKEKAEEKKETPGKEAPKKGGFLSGLRKFLTGKDE